MGFHYYLSEESEFMIEDMKEIIKFCIYIFDIAEEFFDNMNGNIYDKDD